MARGLGKAQPAVPRLELDQRARGRNPAGAIHVDGCPAGSAEGQASTGRNRLRRPEKAVRAPPGNPAGACLVCVAVSLVRIFSEQSFAGLTGRIDPGGGALAGIGEMVGTA